MALTCISQPEQLVELRRNALELTRKAVSVLVKPRLTLHYISAIPETKGMAVHTQWFNLVVAMAAQMMPFCRAFMMALMVLQHFG
jgi:hypothetical protein